AGPWKGACTLPPEGACTLRAQRVILLRASMPPQPPPPTERYGPLALVRIVKEDGRMLILFSHAAP
ncbi:MAG TPA: hypothetical protein VGP17_12525, partial [Solirubrobacteraceae bacterium]|nr:hypothetical protein [Solirubrobacteraceae bacterium]